MSNINNKQTVGRKYPIPAVRTNFLYQVSPMVGDKIKMSEIQQWWYEYALLPRDHYDRRNGPSMIAFAGHFYPHCKSMDRLENIAKWAGHLFVMDDHHDTADGQFDRQGSAADPCIDQFRRCVDRLERLYVTAGDGSTLVPMNGWRPFVLATYAVVEAMLDVMSGVQRRRFINAWRRYLNGLQMENAMIDQQIGCDYNQITQVRSMSGAMDSVFAMIEYSDGLSVSEGEWSDPCMSRLRELCALDITYVNDVYSFEKELHEQNGQIKRMFVNLVAYYVIRESLTVGESMRKTVAMIGEVEREFESLSRQVLDSGDYSPDGKCYVRTLAAMIGGNHYISATLKRYNNIY